MKRVQTRRGSSSLFDFPTGPSLPVLTSPCHVASDDDVQRRVYPSWDAGYRHADASKCMQGRFYGRKPRRFGCVCHLSPLFPSLICFSVRVSLSRPASTLGCHRTCKKGVAGTSPRCVVFIKKKMKKVFPLIIKKIYGMIHRKTARREYAASVRVWNRSSGRSLRSTMLVSLVRLSPLLPFRLCDPHPPPLHSLHHSLHHPSLSSVIRA